jgi:hypothetical protein
MSILNKETLIDAAALGAGVVAGRAATGLVASKLGTKVAALQNPLIANLTPIVGGIATLYLAPGNRYAQGIANGMFASAAAFYVDYALNKAGVNLDAKATAGEGTTGVFMNGVGNDGVFMGNTEGTSDYSSDSYDFTGGDAGEMDF